MNHEFMNLQSAASHILVDPNELRHFAQRGEIESVKRGEEFWFDHAVLDEWAQRHLLSVTKGELQATHRAMTERRIKSEKNDLALDELFVPEGITLDLRAKTKGGAIRDMTDLAIATNRVYDDEGLYTELVAREEVAPTAVGRGAAFLHPRHHDPYFFEETFIAYGRARKPIFFGSPEGEGTRHFFLVAATDHVTHLHILARLAVLTHGTDFIERLDTAQENADVLTIVRECSNF